MSRRSDQTPDNCADCCRAKCDPPAVPAMMVDMVNDMMSRRRGRRAMRPMSPPMMRRCYCRTSRQHRSSDENHNCLDDLVHITPATFCFDFPQEHFSRLHKDRQLPNHFLTDRFLTAYLAGFPVRMTMHTRLTLCYNQRRFHHECKNSYRHHLLSYGHNCQREHTSDLPRFDGAQQGHLIHIRQLYDLPGRARATSSHRPYRLVRELHDLSRLDGTPAGNFSHGLKRPHNLP